MINFEEELKNFQPSLEVEEAEDAIYNHDLTDVTDIITEILRDTRGGRQYDMLQMWSRGGSRKALSVLWSGFEDVS